jgi:hypothetical protein
MPMTIPSSDPRAAGRVEGFAALATGSSIWVMRLGVSRDKRRVTAPQGNYSAGVELPE